MSSNSISPNHREILSARSTITGKQEYLTSTSGVLNVSSSGGGGGNVNLTQVGGASIALGQITMSASLPVVIASNQASIPVAATLTAETTKVIGVIRTADGSGNLLTSTGNALDVNIKTPTTLAANMTQINGVATSAGNGTTDTGTQRVTISSDSTGQINITDGTNKANMLKSDGTVAGENSQLVAPAVRTITFTTSASGVQTILANTDVSHYSWIEVVYTSVGSGLALTGQFSTVSGGAYVNQSTFASNTGSPNGALGTTVSTVYTSPIRGNFFQIAVSALASGTFAGTVTLRATPQPFITALSTSSQSGTWTVGSNSATGSAVPANAFYQAGNARTSSPAAASNTNLVGYTTDIMGEQLVAVGGLVTTAVAVSASNTVVKGSAGRLCQILVTTVGVTAMQIFDNATTNSGTIIGQLPASAAVGSIYQFNMPAANGITVAGSATNPAVTVSWI